MAMGDLVAKVPVRRMVMEAVVIRADGSREDLGAVGYWHRNPLRRWWFKATRKAS